MGSPIASAMARISSSTVKDSAQVSKHTRCNLKLTASEQSGSAPPSPSSFFASFAASCSRSRHQSWVTQSEHAQGQPQRGSGFHLALRLALVFPCFGGLIFLLHLGLQLSLQVLLLVLGGLADEQVRVNPLFSELGLDLRAAPQAKASVLAECQQKRKAMQCLSPPPT